MLRCCFEYRVFVKHLCVEWRGRSRIGDDEKLFAMYVPRNTAQTNREVWSTYSASELSYFGPKWLGYYTPPSVTGYRLPQEWCVPLSSTFPECADSKLSTDMWVLEEQDGRASLCLLHRLVTTKYRFSNLGVTSVKNI